MASDPKATGEIVRRPDPTRVLGNTGRLLRVGVDREEGRRCPECDGPLDGEGFHASEWADCRLKEQWDAIDRSPAGGLSAYVGRLRDGFPGPEDGHRPRFTRDRDGVLLYAGCLCDRGLCEVPMLLAWGDRLIASYEAKVQDFAAETRRVTLHRSVIRRLLSAFPLDAIEGRYRDDPTWQPINWLAGVLADGFAPPDEMAIIHEIHDGGSSSSEVSDGQ